MFFLLRLRSRRSGSQLLCIFSSFGAFGFFGGRDPSSRLRHLRLLSRSNSCWSSESAFETVFSGKPYFFGYCVVLRELKLYEKVAQEPQPKDRSPYRRTDFSHLHHSFQSQINRSQATRLLELLRRTGVPLYIKGR
jgi:hypothetical protein